MADRTGDNLTVECLRAARVLTVAGQERSVILAMTTVSGDRYFELDIDEFAIFARQMTRDAALLSSIAPPGKVQ